METPSSTRRVTRSQTHASMSNNNIPISNFEKGLSSSRPATRKGKQQERSVLFDITNDSPIVGLATGSVETPSSSILKNRSGVAKRTPGSGEALLRGQVKTLLQKVEEEAELSKLSLDTRSFVHNVKGFVNSPAGLLAPTPANTPQVLNLSDGDGDRSINALANNLAHSPLIEETIISQVIEEKEQEEILDLQKSIITRSLLLDFSEKSDSCDYSSDCPSVLTFQGNAESKEKPIQDDDNASVWSVQVNASTLGEEEEEDEVEVEDHEEEDYYYNEVEEDDNDNELVDELCDFISKISMNEKKMLPKFEGKHTRFVYDSDDEIVDDEKKVLPEFEGKHTRFVYDSDDDEIVHEGEEKH